MAWLKDPHHSANPHVWSLHDYDDVIFENPPPFRRNNPPDPSKQYAEVRRFASLVRGFDKRSRIWLSEQGVKLTGSGAPLAQDPGAAQKQYEAATRFLRLGLQEPQIDLVNYYSFFGNPGGFDSALVHPPDQPPSGTPPPYNLSRYPAPNDGNTYSVFRPAYCALTKESHDWCYPGHGE